VTPLGAGNWGSPLTSRRSELRSTILMAMTGHFAEEVRSALIMRHSLRETRRTGRLLLVEDNKVNQTLGRRLLDHDAAPTGSRLTRISHGPWLLGE
jgi:hypothetical protein